MQPLLDQESQILVDIYAGGYTKRSEPLVWKLAGLNVSNRKLKRGTHEARYIGVISNVVSMVKKCLVTIGVACRVVILVSLL